MPRPPRADVILPKLPPHPAATKVSSESDLTLPLETVSLRAVVLQMKLGLGREDIIPLRETFFVDQRRPDCDSIREVD